MNVPLEVFQFVLDQINNRTLSDSKWAQLAAQCQSELADAWNQKLTDDIAGYNDPTNDDNKRKQWSMQFDSDQAAFQAKSSQANSDVQSATGQVSNDQNYSQFTVSSMGILCQVWQYLSGVLKSKL